MPNKSPFYTFATRLLIIKIVHASVSQLSNFANQPALSAYLISLHYHQAYPTGLHYKPALPSGLHNRSALPACITIGLPNRPPKQLRACPSPLVKQLHNHPAYHHQPVYKHQSAHSHQLINFISILISIN